jgi:hypothetical protein
MNLLKEGQKISLFFIKSSSMVEMVCTIDAIYDDRLELVLPQYFMRYIDCLQVGAKLTAKIFSKIGTIDFNTIVLTSPLEEAFTIELDTNSMKFTQSEDLPKISAIEHLEITKEENLYSFKTFEISTEYLKFNSDKKFAIEEPITGVIKLPKDYGIISFKALISEIDPVYDNEYTAEFLMMTEDDRQALLYYMYMYTKDND